METITDSDCVAKSTSLITFDSAEMGFPLEQRTNGTPSRRTHRSKHPSLIGALPLILNSEPPNGRRILNSVEPRGGMHSRNYSLPVMVQSDVHWSGAISRRKRRTQTSSLVSMLFGQKQQGTFIKIHGNALFGQVEQPSTNARDDGEFYTFALQTAIQSVCSSFIDSNASYLYCVRLILESSPRREFVFSR